MRAEDAKDRAGPRRVLACPEKKRSYENSLTFRIHVTTFNPMKITYDPPKRLANLLKHGLDFADLEDGAFFDTALVRPAKLERFQAIGRFDDGTIVVVFALLGSEGISIISMRPASKRERSLFDAHHQAH